MFDQERILQYLGNPGKYQVFIYFVVASNYIVMCFNNLNMAIFGAKNQHHCKLPANVSREEAIPNITKAYGEVTFDSCQVYTNFSSASNQTEYCPNGWEYLGEAGEKNIIMEWDLVCDDAYLKGMSTTIYFIGVMIGGILFGTLSDKYGRRPCLLFTLWGQLVLGIILSFLHNFIAFIVVRFFMGALLQGMQAISVALCMEYSQKRHRTLAGTIFEVVWALGIMYLAFIAWLIRDWHYIQLCLSLHSIVTISNFWLVPESIRWLTTKNKLDEAEATLVMLARRNRVQLPEDPLGRKEEAGMSGEQLQKPVNVPKPKSYSALDLFKTPVMRRRSFVMGYIWLAIAVGYYGLSLNISSFAGNIYLNVFIMGAAELPAYLGSIYILGRFGRKKPLFVYLLIGGVMCIIAAAVPARTASGKDISIAATVLALIGKFGMAGCFSVIFMYTSELFPTVIRNVAVGACACMARLGATLAPQILLLGEVTYAKIPFFIFGAFAILAAGLSFLLPETLDRKLPDTVEDVEQSLDSSAHKVGDSPLHENGALNKNGAVLEVPSENDAFETSTQQSSHL